MYSTIFLPFFLRHLKICELMVNTPFKWDVRSGRLVRVTSGWRLASFKFQCLLHLLYQGAMFHQLLFGRVPITMKLQGLVFFTIYLILLTARWNWGLKIAPMQLINTFLDFEENIPKDIKAQKSFEDKALTWYLYCLQATIPLFPVLNLIVLLNNPCSLPFLGSLSPYCMEGVWSNSSTGVLIFMLVVESWMGYQIFYSGTKWILYLFFVGTVCILDYQHYVEKMLKRIPKNKKQIEAHRSTLLIYAKVGVIEKNYNVFLKGQIVPGMVSCLPGIQIFSQYVCIKLHGEIAMPGFLVFPMVLLDAVLNNILMFSLASSVNTLSRNILSRWKTSLDNYGRRDEIQKQLASCAKMKIQFGSNFIDNGTPLVIQNFCTSQTLSLLLIKSNYR